MHVAHFLSEMVKKKRGVWWKIAQSGDMVLMMPWVPWHPRMGGVALSCGGLPVRTTSHSQIATPLRDNVLISATVLVGSHACLFVMLPHKSSRRYS